MVLEVLSQIACHYFCLIFRVLKLSKPQELSSIYYQNTFYQSQCLAEKMATMGVPEEQVCQHSDTGSACLRSLMGNCGM